MWPCSLSTEHPFFPSTPYPHHTPARAFPLSDPPEALREAPSGCGEALSAGAGCELPRTLLLGTWVNRPQEGGRRMWGGVSVLRYSSSSGVEVVDSLGPPEVCGGTCTMSGMK
jgi:hypothetical protein